MDKIVCDFRSKHNLDFYSKEYDWGGREPEENRIWFRVGTCGGQFILDETAYNIWGIGNNEKGNGHLDDTLEWFEYFCKRDKKDLLITRMENLKFREHLINKRGFIHHGDIGVKKIVGKGFDKKTSFRNM